VTTPAQNLTAAAVLICAASWLALAWGAVTWLRGATDLNDLGGTK
jgi:hypothetical protein